MWYDSALHGHIIIASATNIIAVIIIDQIRREIFYIEKFLWCMFIIVKIKLMALKIDDLCSIYRKKTDKSFEASLWKILEKNIKGEFLYYYW